MHRERILNRIVETVQLEADIRACTICRDLPLGPKPILKLSAEAKILIVGQAPGRLTHAAGLPFDDVSGDRLRNWMGIDRKVFYNDPRIGILPMGFCYPGKGKGGDLPPRPECAEAWREAALAAMPKVELTLVIGRYAIDWHLPEMQGARISDVVKDWQRFWPDHIVLPHPSPRNNRWLKQNPFFEAEVLPRIWERVSEYLD